MWTIELLVISAMILFNSVFAGYEIALASVSLGRLHTLVEQRRPGAVAALRMKEKMEASLAVVQIGITLVGAIAAATGGAGSKELIEPYFVQLGLSPTIAHFLGIALVVAPIVVLTILLGELVPKVFALRNKEWVCLKLSPPMRWFSYTVWPAVWFFEAAVSAIMALSTWGAASDASGTSKQAAIEELQGAAALARVSRLIGDREHAIILSASRLAETSLESIMLPAQYVDMLVADQSLSEALIAARREMHTRFPVTTEAGNPQRIIGYVNLKDIAATQVDSSGSSSLFGLIREMPAFASNTSVAQCLESLLRQRHHIALVRDAADAVVGLVTLEDIVEELMGEIHDELDRMPTYLSPAGPGWIAGGFVTLSDLRNKTGLQLESLNETPVYNLNDWIAQRLDRPPRGGDVLEPPGCRVIVRKTRNVLVQEAYVLPVPADEATQPAAEAPPV